MEEQVMKFSEEAQSIRDDAITAIKDYVNDVESATDLESLRDAIESLMGEVENQLDNVDGQIYEEEI